MTEHDTAQAAGTLLRGSSLGGVLKPLFARARQLLPEVFSGFFVDIDEILFERADNAKNLNEQRIFYDAMRFLRIHRNTVADNTLSSYQRSCNALLGNDLSLQVTAASDPSLTLIEHHVLEEMIALDTMVSALVAACGESLDFLNKRLAYILGQALASDRNPFMPECLCEAFATQLGALQLDMEPKKLIFRQLESALLGSWPQLVADCNQLLIAANILPDLETRKRPIVKAKAEASPPPRADKPPRDTPRHPPPDSQQLLDLQHTLEAVLAEQARPAPPPADPLAVADLVATLSHSGAAPRTADLLTKLSRHGLEAVIADLLATQNRQLADLKPPDRAAIRVLDLVFSSLNGRQLVPAELSDLVLQLELPVAAMALADHRFLAQCNHPGRRLINEIFKVSATFLDGADGASDPLRREVERVIALLREMAAEPRELARLLAEFIDFVEKDKKRLTLREQRLLEEEDARARVMVAHRLVHQHLFALLRQARVPLLFKKFCEDAWSKVVFFSLIRDGQESATWRARLDQLAELLGHIGEGPPPPDHLVAELLQRAEEQLAAISLEPAAVKRWRDSLEAWFRWRREGSPATRGQDFAMVVVEELALSIPGVSVIDPPPAEAVDARALEAVDSLKRGCWVEFRATEDSAPLRCRLAGLVKPAASYVFTNRKGVKVAQEGRHQLAYKIKCGNVLVLDNSHLFDIAFDEVVNQIHQRSHPTVGGGEQ